MYRHHRMFLLKVAVFVANLLLLNSFQIASGAEIVDMVQAKYNGLKTITAKFRQLSVNKVSMIREESRGTFYFSKPGKMRWEYEEPERRLVVSDGEKVWTYLPEQNQVYVARLNEDHIARTPLAFLLGKGDLKKEFDITSSKIEDKERGSLFRLNLNPHVPQMNISNLVLDVDGESYLIVRSDLYDSMGNLISVNYERIAIDTELPPNLFKFSPPEKAEIIEVGGK